MSTSKEALSVLRILEIADEIVVIRNGVIADQGPKKEILPKLIGTTSAVLGCEKFGAWKGDGAEC